ncbi:MAG TPA: SDR family oxidoreductase [Polyangiales bacterium]|nr:SDR family oxidoreductase [Polyangiales bacterium]
MRPTTSSSPSLADRVALITGANTGIGLVSARELARRGAEVFIACRSRERAERARESIRLATGREVHWLELDLGDLDSVRRCANTFLARGVPLHVLINNAGLAGKRGLTRSGFELAFGVNHVGHFLLTQLLVPLLRQSAPARVVTVSSQAHYGCSALDFESVRRSGSLIGLREYQRSKLANILFSAELARRLAGSGVSTYALHPGIIYTDIWREVPRFLHPIMRLRSTRSLEGGAETTLHCATAPELAQQTGLYYDACQPKQPSALARDTSLAAELWRRSLGWVS